MKKKLPKTYEEALSMGYENYFESYHWGYLSRKMDKMKQPVHVAGGKRNGMLYVELPAYTTNSCYIRQYLIKKGDR